MKRFLLITLAFATIAIGAFSLVSWIAPGWFFDISQKIKYPDYYTCRDSGGDFPDRFWLGFNTDRHRERIFLGKTIKEIQEKVPILSPSEKRPYPTFMQLKQSLWTLQFDADGRCVRIFLDKA